MENNNLILGSIHGSGSGLRRTYEESIFTKISDEYINEIMCDDMQKLYFSQSRKCLKLEQDLKYIKDEDFKEVVILGLHQFYESSNYSDRSKPYFVVEIIDKKILHRHLVEERMLLESLRTNELTDEESVTLN